MRPRLVYCGLCRDVVAPGERPNDIRVLTELGIEA
jgi:hypothetical protein